MSSKPGKRLSYSDLCHLYSTTRDNVGAITRDIAHMRHVKRREYGCNNENRLMKYQILVTGMGLINKTSNSLYR